jgi:hypothetical protein
MNGWRMVKDKTRRKPLHRHLVGVQPTSPPSAIGPTERSRRTGRSHRQVKRAGWTGLEHEQENTPTPEKQATSSTSRPDDLCETFGAENGSLAGSRPFATGVAEPSDGELERAIVVAMLDGRGEVAEVITKMLKARQAAKGRSNVLVFDARRAPQK